MVKYRMEEVFGALGQGVRSGMVEQLANEGQQSISALARPARISLPAALKHVRILESSGLVTCRKIGRVQRCTLNRKTLEETTEWLLHQQRFWSGSFERLEKHINSKKK